MFIMPNHEKKIDKYMHPFVTIDGITLIPRKGGKKKLFLLSQSINVIYPNEDNVFMVPNHEKKKEEYMHPCLS